MDVFDETTTLIQRVSESSIFDGLAPPLKIAIFLGGMAFLTTFLVSVTSFTRIVIVLSFVRRALSTQEIPPNPTMLGLALFLTLFTMGPTLDKLYVEAIGPYLKEEIQETEAVRIGSKSFHEFMMRQTRTDDLAVFMRMANIEEFESEASVPFRVLVPAYMISEMKTGFIMGFCIYVPFILVDLFVSTLLMSLGMMMMPPVVISAPIKLLLFVLVDGWSLVVQGLGLSFAQ